MGESGSGVSYFIPEPINFSKVTRSSEETEKPWLKVTLKKINNLIKNKNVLIQYMDKGEPVTPCMDVYKEKFYLMEVLTS